MPRFVTIEELFNCLCREFRPANAPNERVTVQLELSGDGGGVYWVRIEDGNCSCGQGSAASNVDITLFASAQDWLRIVNDELTSLSAFIQGKLKVKGNKALALKLQSWFED